jgi:ubiquinone biosynthesis protein COQ4
MELFQVQYISDPELAYVMQRYRECHDFYHCLVSLPVNVTSELALKYFEFANLGLPLAGLSALFGPLRLTSQQRTRLFQDYVPWAIKCGSSAQSLITVYWEERWGQNVEEMKREFGVWDPPVKPQWGKPLSEKRKKEEEMRRKLEEKMTDAVEGETAARVQTERGNAGTLPGV